MQKRKRLRNNDYLNFIRQQPCLIVGTIPSVPHHVRCGLTGGAGLKPDDYTAVPLHGYEHHTLHCVGEKTFWKRRDRDTQRSINSFLHQYCMEKRIVPTITNKNLSSRQLYDDLVKAIEGAR